MITILFDKAYHGEISTVEDYVSIEERLLEGLLWSLWLNTLGCVSILDDEKECRLPFRRVCSASEWPPAIRRQRAKAFEQGDLQSPQQTR